MRRTSSALPALHVKSLPGTDDITRVELENGIVVLSRPNFASPSVTISGYLNGGSLFDPPGKLGLASFTATSLMRGTQKRTFQEIHNALESAGATLGFDGSVHTTSFGGRALIEDLPLLLSLLSEAIRQPAFPPDQIERLRAQFLTSLAIRAQDTAEMSSMEFDRLLFPGHPYGQPDEGYPETIQAITRQDLVDFHRIQYGPRKMVIAVVGGLPAASVVEGIFAALGDWRNPLQPAEPALPEVLPPKKSIRKHVPIPGKSQTDLVMGCLAPTRKSPDYYPAALGNSILGQFGMMGRIGEVVREKAGLAYYASTSLNAWLSTGSWEVSAGVNPANVRRAIALIQGELRRFTTQPVTAEELSDSQSNFIGRLPLALESNAGVAGALLNIERFQLGLDYYRTYPDLVMAVTPEQILQVAARYIQPGRLVTVTAGTS